MALLQGNSSVAKTPKDAARDFEALVLKQLLAASGAFKSTDTAGAKLHTDLFIDAMADALAAGGGLGIAQQLQGVLGEKASSPQEAPAPVSTQASLASELVGERGRVSSSYGTRVDPLHGELAQHRGVDIAAPEGTPIYALRDGVVRSAGERGGYGQAVELDHGQAISTLYAHASELLVKPGEHVTQGQVIARVGESGRATGAHLHFEMRVDGKPIPPPRALKAYAKRDEDPGVQNP